MMRSESTSAFGQPSDTSPTRGADRGADLDIDLGSGPLAVLAAGLGARRSLLAAVEDLRAPLPAVLCMCALLACGRGTRKRGSINAHAPGLCREGRLGRSLFRANRARLITGNPRPNSWPNHWGSHRLG